MNHNTIAMNENESHDESSSAKGAGTVGINYDAFDPPGFSLKQYAKAVLPREQFTSTTCTYDA